MTTYPEAASCYKCRTPRTPGGLLALLLRVGLPVVWTRSACVEAEQRAERERDARRRKAVRR